MPFRCVSHVTNADMNLLANKGANYSRGLIVCESTFSNRLLCQVRKKGKSVMVNVFECCVHTHATARVCLLQNCVPFCAAAPGSNTE